MNKFRREIMWAALVLIIVLTAMSIYGAFVGADRAQMFFNSIPSAVFWALFALALIAGFVAFRRLIRVPGLLLMHAEQLDEDLVRNTLNVLLKFEDDIEATDPELRGLVRDSGSD